MDRLIYGLGIRHVGESSSKTLARAYGSFAAFHDAALKIGALRGFGKLDLAKPETVEKLQPILGSAD